MYQPVHTSSFKKDIKRYRHSRHAKPIKEILSKLINGKKLPERCRVHKLTEDFKDYWECHVKDDLLIVYKTEEDKIYFARLGTHAEIFD